MKVQITKKNNQWDDAVFANAAKSFILQAASVAGKSVDVSIVDEGDFVVEGPNGIKDLVYDAWRKGILDQMVNDDLDPVCAVAKLQDIYRGKGGNADLNTLFEATSGESTEKKYPDRKEKKHDDKIIGPKELGASLHHWHASQGDPIYGVGSNFYAGKPALRSDVEAAMANLRKIMKGKKPDPEAQRTADRLQRLLGEGRDNSQEHDVYGFKKMGRSYTDPSALVSGEDLDDFVEGLYNYTSNTASIWQRYVDPVFDYVRSSNDEGTYDRAEAIKMMLPAVKPMIDGYFREFTEEFKETFPNGKVPKFVTDAVLVDILKYIEKEHEITLKFKKKLDEGKTFNLDPTRYESYVRNTNAGSTRKGTETHALYAFVKEDDAYNFKKDAEAAGYSATYKKADAGDLHYVAVAYNAQESTYTDTAKETETMSHDKIEAELSDVRSQMKSAFEKKDGEKLKELQDRERALLHAGDVQEGTAKNEAVSISISGNADDPQDVAVMGLVSRVIQAVLGAPTSASASVEEVPDDDGEEAGDQQSESLLAEGTQLDERVAASSVIARQISQDPNVVQRRLKQQVGAASANKLNTKLEDIPSVEVTTTKDGLIIFSGKDAESKAYVAKMANKISSERSVPSDAPLVVVFPSQHQALQDNLSAVARILKANVEGRTKPNWLLSRRKINTLLGDPVFGEGLGPQGGTKPITSYQGSWAETEEKRRKGEEVPPLKKPESSSVVIGSLHRDASGKLVPVSSEAAEAVDQALCEVIFRRSSIADGKKTVAAMEDQACSLKKELAETATSFGGKVRCGSYVIESIGDRFSCVEDSKSRYVEVLAGDKPATYVKLQTEMTTIREGISHHETALKGLLDELQETIGDNIAVGNVTHGFFHEGTLHIVPQIVESCTGHDAVLANQVRIWSAAALNTDGLSEAAANLLKEAASNFAIERDGVTVKIENGALAFEGAGHLYEALAIVLEDCADQAWIKPYAASVGIERYNEWLKDFPKPVKDQAKEQVADGYIVPLATTVIEICACEKEEDKDDKGKEVVEYTAPAVAPARSPRTSMGRDESEWHDATDIWDAMNDKAASGVRTLVADVESVDRNGVRKGAVVRAPNGKVYFIDRTDKRKPRKRISSQPIKINDKHGSVDLVDSFEPSMDLAADTVLVVRDGARTVESAKGFAAIVERWLIESGDKIGPKRLKAAVGIAESVFAEAPKNAALIIAQEAIGAYAQRLSAFGDSGPSVLSAFWDFAESFRDAEMPLFENRIFNRTLGEHIIFVEGALSLDPANLATMAARTNRYLSPFVKNDKRIPQDTALFVLNSLHDLVKIGRNFVAAYKEETPEAHARLEKAPKFKAWVEDVAEKRRKPGEGIPVVSEIDLVSHALNILEFHMGNMVLRDPADQTRLKTVLDAVKSAKGVAMFLKTQLQKEKPAAGQETLWDESASYNVTDDTPDDHAEILAAARKAGVDVRKYYDDSRDQYDWSKLKKAMK